MSMTRVQATDHRARQHGAMEYSEPPVDLDERGIGQGDLIDGLKPISRSDLPGLLDAHDMIWHW